MKAFAEVGTEFWKSNTSKIGVSFLIVLSLVSIFVVLTMPLDFGQKFWSNPVYWVDNPKAAPPEWINLFIPNKLIPHRVLTVSIPSSITFSGNFYIKNYTTYYDFVYEQFPSFLIFKLSNITFYSRPPIVKVNIVRPDNKVISLLTIPIAAGSGVPPYVKFKDEPMRVLLSGDFAVFRELSNFLYKEFSIQLSLDQVASIGIERVIFGSPKNGTFVPLNGRYRIEVILQCYNFSDSIGSASLVIGGRVYGLMGTDTLGRDLFKGILFGFPIALLIGILTSFLTTFLGTILGIISGYIGGKTDIVIQRFSDIINNIPMLPLLIFFTFVFGGKLWVIIAVLVAFGWPGLTILVRSMIISIKSSAFVEAAIASGADKWRIMVKHLFPQVAPFVLAQLIFFTPSAILSEAGLSFLGLGDPSIPTWGQILEYGFRNGAVYLGYWWWILPPGLLIVYSAITFVLIALGMEPVVNPRLRRR